MPAAIREAAVVLWVDVPATPRDQSSVPSSGSSSADHVLALLAARELPATWTFDDVGESRRLFERLALEARHEVALRLDSPGTSAVARSAQSKQLSKQIALVSREGCVASTLVVSESLATEMAAAARRAGVRSIRVERAVPPQAATLRAWLGRLVMPRPDDRVSRPRALKSQGLWEMPIDVRMICAGQNSRNSLAAASREIERAAAQRGVCHAVIDLEHCDRLAKRDWRRLESLLDEVADRRSSTGLCVLTAAQLADRHDAATRGAPGRSILRRAA
ncbi:MAG: hypothetical protein K2Y37_10615 [Pirellulales bacterium]|nr:hypothetical protein [Pirellulales bacterium]